MESSFKNLFGIVPEKVSKTCVLAPIIPKGSLKFFGVERLAKGALYETGQSKNFTLIRTKIGAAFCADAVLYLKETPCINIVLWGACGAIPQHNNMKIGDLVIPKSSLSMESFTQLILKKGVSFIQTVPDQASYNHLLKFDPNTTTHTGPCATFGSLYLESDYLSYLKENDVICIDMESAAVFAASKQTKKRATALFFVTDFVSTKPFSLQLSNKDKKRVALAIKASIDLVLDFANSLV